MLIALAQNDRMYGRSVYPCEPRKLDKRQPASVGAADQIDLRCSKASLSGVDASAMSPVHQLMPLVLGGGAPLQIVQSAVRWIAIQMSSNESGGALSAECFQHSYMQSNNPAPPFLVQSECKILALPIWVNWRSGLSIPHISKIRDLIAAFGLWHYFPSFHNFFMAEMRALVKGESAVRQDAPNA